MRETIVASAIRVGRLILTMPPPARHDDLIKQAIRAGVMVAIKPDWKGFLTSRGRFVRRGEAADLALKAGQIVKPMVKLTSEDVW